jgi:hypothetical protein
MKFEVTLVLLFSLALTACKKSEPVAPLEPKTKPQTVSVDAPAPVPEATPAPAATPESSPPAGGNPETTGETEPPIQIANQLSEAIQKFRGANGRAPRDWNELVAGKFISKMPVAPAGKKFVFDASLNVRMVDAKGP